MRRFIAWFFIFLFTTQVIPLTVWSKTVAQAQTVVTSEDSNEDNKGSSTPKEGKAKKQNTLSEEDYDHVHHMHGHFSITSGTSEEIHHWPDSLYPLFKQEVKTPPPNHC